jgi:hypothetical protein
MSADPITVTNDRMVNPQQLNLYSYVSNNPLILTDSTGLIIDTSALKKKDLDRWKALQERANERNAKGALKNPQLNALLKALADDKRTFHVMGADAKVNGRALASDVSGRFDITKRTGDGKDFTDASLRLNFGLVENASSKGLGPSGYNVDFNKYEGLSDKVSRWAELAAHEADHAFHALQNPAGALEIQDLVDRGDTNPPLPPDQYQRLNQLLEHTESDAYAEEKIVNKELRTK